MANVKSIVKNLISKLEEKKKEKKDNQVIMQYEQVYCVIQRHEVHYKEGLFASFLAIIKMIYQAKEKGLIPVVDMQTYRNPYLKEEEIGIVNAWEYFFEQPSGVTLEDIKGKKNVVYLYEPPYNSFPSDSMDFLTNDKEINYWRMFCKENIKFSRNVEKYLEQYANILEKIKAEPTIGVYLRGTDYARIQPANHAIVPSVQESILKVKLMMEKYRCKQIFLSVEDKSIQEAFEKEFGDKLLFIDQLRYADTGKQGIMVTKTFVESDVQDVGMKYISAVYLMSKCNYLFAARCCGSIGALLLSKGYEKTCFWNRGKYKQDHIGQTVKE